MSTPHTTTLKTAEQIDNRLGYLLRLRRRETERAKAASRHFRSNADPALKHELNKLDVRIGELYWVMSKKPIHYA